MIQVESRPVYAMMALLWMAVVFVWQTEARVGIRAIRPPSAPFVMADQLTQFVEILFSVQILPSQKSKTIVHSSKLIQIAQTSMKPFVAVVRKPVMNGG